MMSLAHPLSTGSSEQLNFDAILQILTLTLLHYSLKFSMSKWALDLLSTIGIHFTALLVEMMTLCCLATMAHW